MSEPQITAEQFGICIAKAIQKNPDSRYWRLVELALIEDGRGLEDVMEICPLLERLAGLTPPGQEPAP